MRLRRPEGAAERVDDLAKGPFERPSRRLRLRQQWLENFPFRIGEIGFVAKVIAVQLRASGRGPHGSSRSGFRHLLESSPSRPFNPFRTGSYRAKTTGKVERPFRYIREDFFLARSFRNLDDLNRQMAHWLDTVANRRVHATTQRVVGDAFAEERSCLRPLPLAPFRSVLKLERRLSWDGMVSVDGNLYSVPDATRCRIVEVHKLAAEVQIFEDGILIATHPILKGRPTRVKARLRLV